MGVDVPKPLNDLYRVSGQNNGERYDQFSAAEYSECLKNTVESRYKAESQLLQAVAAGNTEKALAAYNRIMQHKIPPRTQDALRNGKNMCIILNVLLRKAAQLATVHPVHIDRLSTCIAMQIEAAGTGVQLECISSAMIREYCLLVRRRSGLLYSALIRSCLDYIDTHYAERLSLHKCAKVCSVSPNYLSARFRKEVHITLTEYISRLRTERAQSLLICSTLSVQEIAFNCGFEDPNYFTRIFTRLYKKSPKAYRESMRREIYI